MSEWIKCSDRLPKPTESVGYVFADGKIVQNNEENGSIWFHSDSKLWIEDTWNGGWRAYKGIVSHWMPKPADPEPPK